MSTIRVAALYPDRMNIYADRGNLTFLQRRCEWRGLRFELDRCDEETNLDPDATDLIYIGGGQDRDQIEIATDLVERKRDAVRSAIDRGATVLAVCGGFQLLGHSYSVDGRTIEGLGICDFETRREPGERLIGNIEIEVDGLEGLPGVRTLAGFENHGGRTYLGPEAQPLGRVLKGHGNNGADTTEGVRQGRVIGTYLHGPLLPKNSWFADWLIAVSMTRPGEALPDLEPLDDLLEVAAHENAREACGF